MATAMAFGWTYQRVDVSSVIGPLSSSQCSRKSKLSTSSNKGTVEVASAAQCPYTLAELEAALEGLDFRPVDIDTPTLENTEAGSDKLMVPEPRCTASEPATSTSPSTSGENGAATKRKKKKPWTGPIRPRKRPPLPPWTEEYCKEKQEAILDQLITNELGDKLPVSTIIEAWIGKLTRIDLAYVMKGLEARSRHSLILEVFHWMKKSKKRLLPKPHVCNMVLGILGRAGMVEDAEELFEWIRENEDWEKLRPYNAMIAAYYQGGRPKDAWEIYKKMRAEGISPDEVTYDTLICGSSRYGYDICQLYTQMKSTGATLSLRAYNSVMGAFTKEGKLDKVEEVMTEMIAQQLRPDLFSFNSLISAYAQTRRPERGLEIFNNMKAARVQPDIVTYTTLMQMFSRSSMHNEAIEIFEEMVANKCQPDCFTYSLLVNIYGRAGLIPYALQVFHKLQQEGYKPTLVTYSSLISAHLQRGMFEESNRYLSQMEAFGIGTDVHLLNTVMNAYARAGLVTEAGNILRRLQFQGVSPNSASHRIMVEGLIASNRLAEASAAYSSMVAAGFKDERIRLRLSRATRRRE